MRSEIHQTWRATLTRKLQDSYGLPEEEALTKVEEWLQWLTQGDQSNGTREAHEESKPA
jgi:hypothetical protein